ncbi:SMI1/KNR4 family protein [Paenibacillus sp. LPE1-1-1.1]|uniref:SMI1/KNR4 family protein n=1 Tax=Paenibacillus sp. LPE1-1-1.1 TaxID=3135230 RepID=UPI0034421410
MKTWETWEDNIKVFIKAIEFIGGEVDGYLIKPSVSISVIKSVEEELGVSLPESFIKVISEFISGMEMVWSLPDDDEREVPIPEVLKGISASNFSWSIENIINVEKGRKRWEQEVFSDEEDEYDRVWHNKLGLMEVGNGDYIAFDLSISNDPPVVYLSHDDGEGHGYILGHNFIDFIDKWTKIGCVGCEDWQLLPFMEGPSTGIQPDLPNAQLWRNWLNIKI